MSEIKTDISKKILGADFSGLARLRDSISISDEEYHVKKKYIDMIDRRLRPKESNCLVEHGDENEFHDELSEMHG